MADGGKYSLEQLGPPVSVLGPPSGPGGMGPSQTLEGRGWQCRGGWGMRVVGMGAWARVGSVPEGARADLGSCKVTPPVTSCPCLRKLIHHRKERPLSKRGPSTPSPAAMTPAHQ